MPKKAEITIKRFPISDIHPHPRNPRKHPDPGTPQWDMLKRSLQHDYFDPIVVNKQNGLLVSGHLRTKVLREMGVEEVDAVVVEYDDATHLARLVAANKQAGVDDLPLLKDVLEELDTGAIDLEAMTGWGMDEVEDLMNQLHQDGEIEEDEVPPVQEQAKTERGRMYQLGRHRLMCGDATSEEDVKRLMDGDEWDVCVCDPPYDEEHLYPASIPAAISGRKLVVFWDMRRFACAANAAGDRGWRPLYEFVWDCCQSWYTPNRPLARHKAAGVFGDDPYFNFDQAIIRDGKKREAKIVSNTRGSCDYVPLNGAVHIRSVEQFPNTQQNDEHGHGKPMQWIRAIWQGIGGGLYFDMFGGTGTTLIACEQTDRSCRMMEIDPRYCDVIVRRYANLVEADADEIFRTGVHA